MPLAVGMFMFGILKYMYVYIYFFLLATVMKRKRAYACHHRYE